MNESEMASLERRLRAGRLPGLREARRSEVLRACGEKLAPDWTQRALRLALVAAVLVTVVAEFSERVVVARMAAMDAPGRYEKQMRQVESDVLLAGTTLEWWDPQDEMRTGE